jgi:hypothetical protein
MIFNIDTMERRHGMKKKTKGFILLTAIAT